jgi:DNA repair exonuclease SbcCD ATPase subunit
MRINRIELTNFRSFAGSAFDLPERVTFLIAPNHRGKSSVADALNLTLVGRCRGTDKRGAGAENLIRDVPEATAMRIRLDVTAGGETFQVERMQNARTSTLAVAGVVGTRDGQTALLDRLGAPPELLEACLNTSHFLDLAHAEGKNLLLQALRVRVPIDGESLTLAEVDQRLEHWTAERKARRKVRDGITVPPKPAAERPNVPALEQKLAALREEEKQIIAASSEQTGRRKQIVEQLEHADREADRLSARLGPLETAAGATGATMRLDDAIEEFEERLASVALTDTERETADEARRSLVSDDGRLQMLRETHAAIGAHLPDRGCVMNPQIECRTPAKSFKAELESLAKQIQSLQEAQSTARATIGATKTREEKIAGLEQRAAVLREQREKRDSVRRDLELLNETRQRLMFERDELPAPGEPSAELQQLQARLRKGDETIARAREVLRAFDTYEKATADRTAAAKAFDEAEAKVELLGPKGARVRALGAALEDFQARINGGLARFGYQLRIVADPWLVLVNSRPAELLSASERFQVGVAIQLALASVTGVHVVAIDAADVLVGEDRRALGAVLDAADPAVQVLVTMSQVDSFEPPAIADWRWVRIHQVDGVSRFEPVEQLVAA